MRASWGLLLTLTLEGCGETDPAQLYIAAARDPMDPRACRGIADARLYGECVTMVAAEVAKQTGTLAPAEARCDQLPAEDPWRGECYFLVVDTLELVGEEARRLCLQAGTFTSWCLGHALHREGRPLLAAAPRGAERQAYLAVQDLALFYFGDEREAAGQKLWSLVTDELASRDWGQPFTPEICGEVPDQLCRAVFLTRLRLATRDAGYSEDVLQQMCGQEAITAADVAALGIPAWTEAAEPIAQASLRQLCGRRRRGGGPGPGR